MPLVSLAVVVLLMAAWALMTVSSGERRLQHTAEERARARMIAESGLARASALLLQHDFEERWHRQELGDYGFTGSLRGRIAGGVFEVHAEDVVSSPPTEGLLEERLTYDRVDFFARGTYGGQSIILYRPLALMPRERVYRRGEEGWELR